MKMNIYIISYFSSVHDRFNKPYLCVHYSISFVKRVKTPTNINTHLILYDTVNDHSCILFYFFIIIEHYVHSIYIYITLTKQI